MKHQFPTKSQSSQSIKHSKFPKINLHSKNEHYEEAFWTPSFFRPDPNVNTLMCTISKKGNFGRWTQVATQSSLNSRS
jgi:hypothetical protein